jgi:hypothetical protein
MNELLWGAKLGRNTAGTDNIMLETNKAREGPGWGAGHIPFWSSIAHERARLVNVK